MWDLNSERVLAEQTRQPRIQGRKMLSTSSGKEDAQEPPRGAANFQLL
jgi:hypothetical protein